MTEAWKHESARANSPGASVLQITMSDISPLLDRTSEVSRSSTSETQRMFVDINQNNWLFLDESKIAGSQEQRKVNESSNS
jgi:hypothetical protein